MRRSRRFLLCLAIQTLLLAALLGHGWWRESQAASHQNRAMGALASRLGLTDVAIWTEARYARHPSQADFFSPFQDFPAALDHFPAGSILAPPRFTTAAPSIPIERPR